MIGRSTVFVVGAGASSEVNLPLGEQLTKDIASALGLEAGYTSDLVRAALSVAQQRFPLFRARLNDLFYKASEMSSALATASSIDVFIHNHADDPRIGM